MPQARSKKSLKFLNGERLKERIKQLETQRDSSVMAFRTLEKKYEETKAPPFNRMASSAIEQVKKIQSEIEKLKNRMHSSFAATA
jgi:predicted  nucleic acid-binding Zn-ribbon protein